MKLSYAKEGRKTIGYTRLQVLNTSHTRGNNAANKYMEWYNSKKFGFMPTLTGVLEPEPFDTSSIPEIGLKYKHLRPKTKLPLDVASEPEVENESPEKESDSEESASEAEEDSNKKPSPHDEEPRRDEEKSAAPTKDTDAHPSDEAEDAEANLPSRGEDLEEETTVPPAKRGLVKEFTNTMKGLAESVTGTRPKKRKNVAPAKPAPKSKKASPQGSSRVPKPNEDVVEAPDEDTEANAVTPGGHA